MTTDPQLLQQVVDAYTLSELQERKVYIDDRLKEISVPVPKSKSANIEAKSDTHWDFVMKEMMWLAADFAAERKRQVSLARKAASGIKQHHKTRESRKVRELADAELKRRRLAGKIGRQVHGWWTKIERVISYKQKLSADEERRKAMNQQLVKLIKLTERYGEQITSQNDEDDALLSIEEALAASSRLRGKARDYTALKMEQGELYGESTSADSGSDGSFVPDSEEDDETTFVEAEEEELRERLRGKSGDGEQEQVVPYAPDPREVEKLQEESTMYIDDVLRRLQEEAGDYDQPMDDDKDMDFSTKRVTFAEKSDVLLISPPRRTKRSDEDAGHEADDDADASDVEDYNEDASDDGSEEFQINEHELVDDETTIEAEERLGRDMSAADEIMLLQNEAELPIEELCKRYGAVNERTAVENHQHEKGEEEEDEEGPDSQNAEQHSDIPAAASSVGLEYIFQEDDAEDEYQPSMHEVDDETTIEAEERLGREMTPEQEIALLQRESEIPIEDLRDMYTKMEAAIAPTEDDVDQDEDETGDLIESTSDDQNESTSESQEILRSFFGKPAEEDADEFVPDTMEVDDETTIEVEERLGRDMSYEDEIALLKQESEMPVEELRKLYSGIDEAACVGTEEDGDNGEILSDSGEEDGEEEFQPEGEAVDDETTIKAEERLGREMSVEDEIALLKRESETPIEELRAMHDKVQAEALPRLPVNGKRQRFLGDTDEEGKDALKRPEESERRARSTLASRPFILAPWVKLRKYQQIGLNWLVSIQTRRLNGILADEMGLGKTLQTIAALAYLASYKGIWGPHIVIVPTSVIVNWETEFKRFCPAMKVLTYYGSAKRRKELRTGWTKANWYHVVITSYQLAVQDAFAFKRKKWYYMILDEAHNIKNFQSQRWQTLINFNSQRRLLLTGTPLQNSLTELWSLLHFLMPYVFRSRKEFSYWFSNPMNNIIEGNVKRSDDLITRLHGIIRPFILRRLKRDVETQLPGKYEHIVKCQMSRRQMFLYEEFMARSSTRQALKKGGNFMGMMNVLMQLRKVCNHPDLFEPRAVITPFAMEGIDFILPKFIVDCLNDASDFWKTSSTFITVPLWCGGNGIPCPSECIELDVIATDALALLTISKGTMISSFRDTDIDEPLPFEGMDGGLANHLQDLFNKQRKNKERVKETLARVNTCRCNTKPFLYPLRLQSSLLQPTSPLHREEPDAVLRGAVLSTPQELLSMRKKLQRRADDVEDLVKKFVFCIPRAGASRPRMLPDPKKEDVVSSFNEMLLEPVEEYLRPYQEAAGRLSSFFPDKQLVQFDAGKLQTLSGLLHDLKRDGHRVLIFTQMSKMLDVLEAFLNLNGHTYLRLDGSTGVEKRQRLMDKFNNDEKVFCFILSTRSGGLGINLTGADTVIFYDSDWNPAMDAQAQDRAHRIGQTRDVHIYRLITEHSIEENIWTKAKQKRNLDLIVMDEGKFDANHTVDGPEFEQKDELKDMYSKGGLRDILGVSDTGDSDDNEPASLGPDQQQGTMTSQQMEKAMASLEDEDDVAALHIARKEAEDELKEFDESIEYKKDEDDETEGKDKDSDVKDKGASASETDEKFTTDDDDEKDETKIEEDMVKEFTNWQSTVGMDVSAIEASLSPTEKYGLHFRERIDPFWSVFAIMEERRRLEAAADNDDDVDVEELERMKAEEEQVALEHGDLLGTMPRPDELPRQRHMYLREKARLRASKKRRKLTGENWEERLDALTKLPFWYNVDTGEAIWEKPRILHEIEADEIAYEKKWNAMPLKPLILIMTYLVPFPERTTCARVCSQWRDAATDISFVLHVLPVELGATHSSLKLPNHFATIAKAMEVAQAGDMIELADGHYWVNEPGLEVTVPLKFVGDENDPSHVIIELSGCIQWAAKGGFIEGIMFRRPKISAGELHNDVLSVAQSCNLDIVHSILDNQGSNGSVVKISGGKCNFFDVAIKGSKSGSGIYADNKATIFLDRCQVEGNKGAGIRCTDSSSIKIVNCHIEENSGVGLLLQVNSKGEVIKSRFAYNGGILEKESGSSCVPCSGNVALARKPMKSIPGFRIIRESPEERAKS